MNTTTQSTAIALLQAGLSMPLETIVLSRSQRKALDYAKSLHDKGQLSDLAISGNKTDNVLFHALNLRNEVNNALNNNQKIYSLIQKCNGSDTRFELPKSAKIADLFTWVAALEAQIRGKADSTQKAIESRRTTIQTRFGDCINLAADLQRLCLCGDAHALNVSLLLSQLVDVRAGILVACLVVVVEHEARVLLSQFCDLCSDWVVLGNLDHSVLPKNVNQFERNLPARNSVTTS